MSNTDKLAMNIQLTSNEAGFASSLLSVVPFDRPVVVVEIDSRASRRFEQFLETTYPTVKWVKGAGKKNISAYYVYPDGFGGNRDVSREGNPFLENLKTFMDSASDFVDEG